MAATVKPSTLGGWVAICPDCRASCAGGMAMTDLWADVHNNIHHNTESENQ